MKHEPWIVAGAWFCLSALLWTGGRDVLNWAMNASLLKLLLLQMVTCALSAVMTIETFSMSIIRFKQWKNAGRARAYFYTSMQTVAP
jgi:hypothetical protein